MPRVAKTRGMPLSRWPEVDRLAWSTARTPASIFSTGPRRLRLKQATWEGFETSYGFWLSWLLENGLLEEVACPSARVSEERLDAYVAWMRALDLAPYSVAGRVGGLGRALEAMAPLVDTSWIRLGASRLHAEAEPAKDIRKILRPGVDLVELGFALMESIENPHLKGGSYASLRFRDGLIIAFLAHCPFRRRNLAALELGQHVFREKGAWRIEVPAGETKTGRAVRCAWPPALVEALETYLQVHRPILLGCGRHDTETVKLWVNRLGGPADHQGLYQAVSRRTEAAFGKVIYPHAFRHIAATDAATLTPEHATLIKDILGHSGMEPSEKYYNRARSIGAAQRMHRTFEACRSPLD